jgi:hypothetical protein
VPQELYKNKPAHEYAPENALNTDILNSGSLRDTSANIEWRV